MQALEPFERLHALFDVSFWLGHNEFFVVHTEFPTFSGGPFGLAVSAKSNTRPSSGNSSLNFINFHVRFDEVSLPYSTLQFPLQPAELAQTAVGDNCKVPCASKSPNGVTALPSCSSKGDMG